MIARPITQKAWGSPPLQLVRTDDGLPKTALSDIQGDSDQINVDAAAYRKLAQDGASLLVQRWNGGSLKKSERRVLIRRALEIEIAALRDAADALEKNLPKIEQPLPAKPAA